MATGKKERKKRTNNVPENESKTQKFQRLANQRVSGALKKIHQIGNLGAAGYESTPEQREKISSVLAEAVADTVNRLNKTVAKPTSFTL